MVSSRMKYLHIVCRRRSHCPPRYPLRVSVESPCLSHILVVRFCNPISGRVLEDGIKLIRGLGCTLLRVDNSVTSGAESRVRGHV